MFGSLMIRYYCIVSDFRDNTQYQLFDQVSEKRKNTQDWLILYCIVSVSPLPPVPAGLLFIIKKVHPMRGMRGQHNAALAKGAG
jgi:hypothetical protein